MRARQVRAPGKARSADSLVRQQNCRAPARGLSLSLFSNPLATIQSTQSATNCATATTSRVVVRARTHTRESNKFHCKSCLYVHFDIDRERVKLAARVCVCVCISCGSESLPSLHSAPSPVSPLPPPHLLPLCSLFIAHQVWSSCVSLSSSSSCASGGFARRRQSPSSYAVLRV